MASIPTGGRQGPSPEPQSIVMVIDFPKHTERLELKALMGELRAQAKEWLDKNPPVANLPGQVRVTPYEVETKKLHIARRLR